MTVFIVTYRTEQQDSRIGAVYFDLGEAKAEVARLEEANPRSTLSAGIVIREATRPREWTDEQKRWMRGAK